MLLRSDPLPIWRVASGWNSPSRQALSWPWTCTAQQLGISGRDWDGTGFVRDATARVGDGIRWDGIGGTGSDRYRPTLPQLSRQNGPRAKLGRDSNGSLGLESHEASNARLNQELRRKLNWDGIELRSAQRAAKRVHRQAEKDTKKTESGDGRRLRFGRDSKRRDGIQRRWNSGRDGITESPPTIEQPRIGRD
jgi:hypothetical protein